LMKPNHSNFYWLINGKWCNRALVSQHCVAVLVIQFNSWCPILWTFQCPALQIIGTEIAARTKKTVSWLDMPVFQIRTNPWIWFIVCTETSLILKIGPFLNDQ
jgi:hypothetical protein